MRKNLLKKEKRRQRINTRNMTKRFKEGDFMKIP